MRKALYVIIVLLLFAAPVQKLDVAHLEPVEVVHVAKEGNIIVLTTDTGAKGMGGTAFAALEDLKNKTAGVIYLNTAEYLLVGDGAVDVIDEMRDLMKGTVKLCRAQTPNMEIAANYLETHGQLPMLKDWKTGADLPVWNGEKIIEKKEKSA